MRMKWEMHDGSTETTEWIKKRRRWIFKRVPMRTQREREIWNIIKIAEQKKLVIFSFNSRNNSAHIEVDGAYTHDGVCEKERSEASAHHHLEIGLNSTDGDSPSCSELHGSAIMFVSYVTCPRQSNRLLLLVNHAHSLARYAMPDLLHHLISGAPPHRPTDETRSDTLIKMKWIFNYKKCNSVELGSRLFKLRRASEQTVFFSPFSLQTL